MNRKRWASARTLADLGQLTALWLEGVIASQPGYAPGCGPDPETADLVPVLAACNRAGFVTDASQPGYDGPGYDGRHWQQRASVEGFASRELAERLRRAAQDARLFARVQPASRWRVHSGHAITVTRCDGQPCTRFGAQLPRRDIRDSHVGYGGCLELGAVRALCAASRVTIVDLAWGSDDLLWPVLAKFADAEQEAGRR